MIVPDLIKAVEAGQEKARLEIQGKHRMNERIKELLEQAGVKYVTIPKDTVYEKFAELIIKECAEQIKTHSISASSEGYGDYEIGFNVGLFHALRTTKEHFGVDE